MKKNSSDNHTQEAELQRFEANLRQFQQAMFAYLGRLGLSQAEAEDVAQETFLRAWRARRQFDSNKGAYSTWLFRIARNVALNTLEHQRKTVVFSDAETVMRASTDARASDSTEQRDRDRAVSVALAGLSVDDRDVLSLAYISGLSTEQAANVCGCRVGTFRTRLSRARERLLKQLEQSI